MKRPDVSGLFNTPLAIAIYCLVALIILWPLVNRFVVRRLRPPAHEVHHGHAHVLVELAEELAADSEDLSEQERVLARAERETGDDDGAGRRSGRAGEGRSSDTADAPRSDVRRE